MPRPASQVSIESGSLYEPAGAGLPPHLHEAQESFEAYMATAKAQPDSAEAVEAILEIIDQALASGEVDFALQNIMWLAAEACSHQHLEEPANEAGRRYDKVMHPDEHGGNGPGHSHTGNKQTGAGRHGREKTRKKAAQSLGQFLLTYQPPASLFASVAPRS